MQPIPARSPDLNPIENLFNFCKRGLLKGSMGISSETLEQFRERVISTVKRVCALHTDRTVDSMGKRISQIIRSGGDRASY